MADSFILVLADMQGVLQSSKLLETLHVSDFDLMHLHAENTICGHAENRGLTHCSTSLRVLIENTRRSQDELKAEVMHTTMRIGTVGFFSFHVTSDAHALLSVFAFPFLPMLKTPLHQVRALISMPCGGIPATYLNSQQSAEERKMVYRELAKSVPSCKLLYVTPEQLVKSGTLLDILQRLHGRGLLAAVVIDEVSCDNPLPGSACGVVHRRLQCRVEPITRRGRDGSCT